MIGFGPIRTLLVSQLFHICKSNRTEWSPVRSVIRRVMNKNRTTAIRESDLLITNMITDRIGRHDILLPIHQIYDRIWERNLTSDIRFHKKNQLTRRNARQQRAQMTRSVHLHRHDVLTVPLTVLLYCPITYMTRKLSCYTIQLQAWRVHCPISVQIGLVITNHVREFCCSFD